MAAAGDKCLKGPTAVKDYDASAMAVENQHKTLEKNIGIF
jgi:hypothetical protein